MLKVHIQSLGSEAREFSLTEDADKLEKLFDEFFGEIEVNGTVRVHSNRYAITGQAKGKAKLLCDLSLEEYEEIIVTDFDISALKSELDVDMDREDDTLYISPDDNYIDISDIISEQLSLALPMKRIAPDYRGKELKDIRPEVSGGDKEDSEGKPNDTWDALKNIKLN